MLGSLSRNTSCLPVTVFKTIHQKPYSTARATVKEAGTPSPRAVSSRVGASPRGRRCPRGGTRGPSPAGTPSFQSGRPTGDGTRQTAFASLAGRTRPGCSPRGGREAGLAPLPCPAGLGTFLEAHRTDQKPREPRGRVASPGASEPAWTAAEAKPEPDQTQRRIWETLNKPHSPEDIVLTNSSAQNGFNLTPGNPGEQKLASEVLKGSGRDV